MSIHKNKVLVLGYRSALIAALKRQNIPFSVWHDKRLKLKHPPKQYLCAPFFKTHSKNLTTLNTLMAWGPFTHVIASVERSVYPASKARRFFKARMSKHSVILRCHDKLMMKNFLKAHGIPMTPFTHADRKKISAKALQKLGLPLVLKGRTESGGKGIVFFDKHEDLEDHLNRNKILETFIDAQEISVESYIHKHKLCFSNITSYQVKKHVNIVPAQLNKHLKEKILQLNATVIQTLNIEWGMTHVEMYINQDGIFFGEIALRPPGGYIMDLIKESYNFDPWEAFVAIELNQAFDFPSQAQFISAACIVAPKSGKVLAIKGLDQVKTHPQVIDLQIKAKLGQTIFQRESVGTDSGRAIAKANTLKEILNVVKFIDKTLIIDVL